MQRVVVSEAGASVYSASEFASQEMPDVDVSLRGAASIARRLQDPLAELVKIDPKSIGVGQYQHDVNQSELARTLDAVVEDCVNSRRRGPQHRQRAAAVARVGPVGQRGQGGGALARGQRRLPQPPAAAGGRAASAPRPSSRARASCASAAASNPLDMTGVHPETYPVVEKILAHDRQAGAAS